MRRVRSSDTCPELLFRRALRSRGIRFRAGSDKLPGKPDIVLPSKRIAIFIDGDFWHGGQWGKRHLSSLDEQFKTTQSRAYWLRKIKRTMHRDCLHTKELLTRGWKVLRFWESHVYKDLESCIKITEETIAEERSSYTSCSLLPTKTFAEFFSGIGLMRIGLEKQGWAISFANDIDDQKCEMYRAHFPDADEHLVCGDIHTLGQIKCHP
jgi:DNA mismatch endonuclease (patch repair protein)